MRLLQRSEWGATAQLGPNMHLPAKGATIHQSVTIADDDHSLEATADVANDMRELEAIGVSRFGRFSYSFAIHPSGVVGIGAGFTVGAHTKDHNSTSFGIVFIGRFNEAPPTPEALAACVELLAWLRSTGKLVDGYYLDGHRDHKATECPGPKLYPLIQGIHAQALGNPNPHPEEDDMTPEQAKQLADTARRVDGMEEQVAGMADKLDILFEQLIGKQTKAGPEALRQLIKETHVDADVTEKRGRPAKKAAAPRKAAATKKAATTGG